MFGWYCLILNCHESGFRVCRHKLWVVAGDTQDNRTSNQFCKDWLRLFKGMDSQDVRQRCNSSLKLRLNYHESHLCNDRLRGILLPLESQGHQVLIMAQLGSYWTTNDHQILCPTMWNLCVCAWLYLTMPEYCLTSRVLADHMQQPLKPHVDDCGWVRSKATSNDIENLRRERSSGLGCESPAKNSVSSRPTLATALGALPPIASDRSWMVWMGCPMAASLANLLTVPNAASKMFLLCCSAQPGTSAPLFKIFRCTNAGGAPCFFITAKMPSAVAP